MLLKGNHKIIWILLFNVVVFAANAKPASVSTAWAYFSKDSVILPLIAKKNFLIRPETGIAKVYTTQRPAPFTILPSTLRPDYYTSHWGIFCESEWRLEKKTGVPIRIRLGSVEYVDRMEGKGNRGISEW